jgi:hypothetical protein
MPSESSKPADPAHPEAVHQRRRERTHEAEQQEAKRQRRRDLGGLPAELALQR